MEVDLQCIGIHDAWWVKASGKLISKGEVLVILWGVQRWQVSKSRGMSSAPKQGVCHWMEIAKGTQRNCPQTGVPTGQGPACRDQNRSFSFNSVRTVIKQLSLLGMGRRILRTEHLRKLIRDLRMEKTEWHGMQVYSNECLKAADRYVHSLQHHVSKGFQVERINFVNLKCLLFSEMNSWYSWTHDNSKDAKL